nr:ribonuclease H-like domain-containing protein [Tanacetum cinerariifolium]
MEHNLSHTDYPIWQVIHNVNGHVSVTTDTNGIIKVLPHKTAEEVVAREWEKKVMTTLLMALPEDHLANILKMDDAKENTNDVSTSYSISSPSVSKSQKEGSSSYTDEVIHSFFANQSSYLQLDYDDLEQINDDDIEEMDLKWQVAMISMRIKKFHKRTGRKLQFDTKDPVDFDKTKVECFNCHKIGQFARDCRAKENQDSRRRDVSNSGSNNEVKFCSKACEESYARLKILYDDQRDKLGDAKALKEKEYLKTKFENWQNSSKNLSKLFNTQMSANDKFGLGYGDYRYGSILSDENEVLQSVFMNKASDLEDTPVSDRFVNGMHATLADESDSKPSEYASCKSDSNVETSTSMPEPVEMHQSFAFTDSVKHVKIYNENVKESGTPNHSPKIEKQGRNGHSRKGLGYAFTRKACFVCGSFSHLIRDYDFRDKRMAKQAELAKSKNKDDPHRALKDKGIFDSGCSRHMTGNKAHLADYQEFKGGFVAIGGSKGRITSKGKIKAGKLDFEDDDPHRALKDKGVVDSRCSRHMIGNKAHLADYQEFKGGSIAFGGSNGRITSKRMIKTGSCIG